MIPFLNTSKIAVAIALGLMARAATAEEGALYDAAAPADAVFVRVLSERGVPLSGVTFAGAQLSIGAEALDTYIAISAAVLNGVPAGAYYSLAHGETGPLTIAEPARETSAKVHLFLLNTSREPVRLVAPGKDLVVIERLDSGQSASRAVNPIEIELAVERVGDGARLGNFDVRMSRGQNLTFIARDASARLIENNFGPVLEPN